ncbi:MAG TPA: hypothetical protein QF564_21170 [Pirellulaceae bacterium]|nr:hypothetical protein [Pirellulaceae bacterium]
MNGCTGNQDSNRIEDGTKNYSIVEMQFWRAGVAYAVDACAMFTLLGEHV